MRYVVGYTPGERGADAVALASAMARAQEGLDAVPAGVEAKFHNRQAESFAAGLIDAAVEFQAGLVVVPATTSALKWRTEGRSRKPSTTLSGTTAKS